MDRYSKNILVVCVLALAVVLTASTIANGQTAEKLVVPPVATVYLQNVSPANLGLATVLVKTQEFGARVALRAEANKLPSELRSDISDHLGKYVTVQSPQAYDARLLGFEVRNCSKEAAGNLALAVAAAYLGKLAESRIDGNLAQVKAINAELEARMKEREESIAKLAALKPADVSSLQGYSEILKSRLQSLAQEQSRLQAAKQQADATLEMLKKKDPQAVPQVRTAMESDSILADLRRQKDAMVYSTTPAKDPEAATKMATVIDGKIALRTKDLVQTKLEALRAEAQDQQETATAQLTDNQGRLDAAMAALKGLDEIMQKAQLLGERTYAQTQVITHLEERLTDLRIQSDSGQDTPKILGKSIGE
jgi:hypothetical protein